MSTSLEVALLRVTLAVQHECDQHGQYCLIGGQVEAQLNDVLHWVLDGEGEWL